MKLDDERDELDGYEHRTDVHLRLGLTSQPIVVEQCVCGGEILVTRRARDELAGAVATHNETPRHRAWRRREKL